MRATLFSLAVAAPAVTLAMNSVREFQFPDSFSLEKRQTSGPVYECHANCGNAILQSQGGSKAYCTDKEWRGLLDACLDCALEYDIWKDYGSGVAPAAKACGLDATPKPAGSGGTSDTTSKAAAATEASSKAPTPAASSNAAATTEAGHSPTIAVSTSLSSAESSNAATPPAQTTPAQAGAGALGLSTLAVAACALVAVMANFQQSVVVA